MIQPVRTVGVVVVLLAASLAATPLYAQPAAAAGGTFVDGFATAVSDDTRYPLTHVDGTVVGYGVALGIDSGRSGVEVDVHVPQ